MASINKRKWMHNGQEKVAWVVRYTDGGGKRRLKTFESKKDADRWRLQAETEIEQGVHIAERATMTFSAAAELWLKDCQRRIRIGDRMTNGAFIGYQQKARQHIYPKIGNHRLTEITSLSVQSLINEMAEKYARATVTHALKTVGLILKFAVRNRWLKRNVLRDEPVRVPGPASSRVAVPSLDDIRRLLDAMREKGKGERHLSWLQRRAAVALALFGGLRKGEIAGLQWQHVMFHKGIIQVRHALSHTDGLKGPKSAAGVRDVPIAPHLLAALLELHRFCENPQEGFVFIGHTGKPIGPVHIWYCLWQPLAKRAGLCDPNGRPRFHFHALRHAAVSLLISDGLSPMHIKSFIGHASVTTTMNVYGHLFPEDERIKEAVVSVAARFDATRALQGPSCP